jgi:hypothetical protein
MYLHGLVKMKKKVLFLIVLLIAVSQMQADKLTTIDRKEYEGKMVAFKFNTVYFNVYKFGKILGTRRFPLYEVWKIEFNTPRKEGLESSFEMESNYKKLRRGKRSKKLTLEANQKWMDTGVTVKIGQEILFSASGSIYIDKDTQVYQNGELTLNWNNKKSIPNQPTGAIIAKVGKRGEAFYVGDDKAPFQITQKGNLFIGVNDFDFSDNTGKFTVTVYY